MARTPAQRKATELLREQRKRPLTFGKPLLIQSNALNIKRRISWIAAAAPEITELRRVVKSKLWIKNKAFIGRLRSKFKVRESDQLRVWKYKEKWYVEVTSAEYARGKYYRVTSPAYIEALNELQKKQEETPGTH